MGEFMVKFHLFFTLKKAQFDYVTPITLARGRNCTNPTVILNRIPLGTYSWILGQIRWVVKAVGGLKYVLGAPHLVIWLHMYNFVNPFTWKAIMIKNIRVDKTQTNTKFIKKDQFFCHVHLHILRIFWRQFRCKVGLPPIKTIILFRKNRHFKILFFSLLIVTSFYHSRSCCPFGNEMNSAFGH